MADKDLTIRIKSVGAEAAADAVNKVAAATDDLKDAIPSNQKGFGGMLDNVPKRADDAADGIERLKDETAELKETADQAAKSIFSIEDAAKQAGNQADVLEAKRRLAEKEDPAKPPKVPGGKKPSGKVDPNFGLGEQLATKITAAAPAAIASVGVAALKSTAEAIETLKELKKTAHETGQELGIEFTSQMDAAIEGFGPLNKGVKWVKDGLSTLWKTLKDPVGELTGVNQVNEKLKEQEGIIEKLRTALMERTAQHVAENQKILESDRQLLAAQQSLAQGREERAGISNEQSAANEIQRVIEQNALEKKKIVGALVAAQQREITALADAKNKQLSEATRAAASKIAKESEIQVADLERTLSTKIQTDGLAIQNSVEAAQKKSTDGLNAKLTANAQDLQAKLQAIVDEKGGETGAATRIALGKITEVLADGKATYEDVAKLQYAVTSFYQSQDSNQDGLRASAVKLRESIVEAQATKKAVDDQVTKTVENQALAAQAVETLGVSQTEIGKNIEASAASAAQVKASIDNERTSTVSAIQGLAPQPQDGQAIVSAIQATAKALEQKDIAIAAAFAAWQAGIVQIDNRLRQQQSQINQLYQRLR